MKFHGITLQEGSTVANMTLASGTSFPSNPNEGELFFRSDSDTSVRGMYAYIGGNWDRLASADALTVPSAANFPSTANVGDLFYKDSNDINEALYVYNGSSWVATGNSGGTSTVDGDLSGTISIGGTSTLTLDTVASAGTSGSASKTVTVTIDAKGRVTSLVEQDVAIAASQVTSGTFADARIAQSNVTQHQAAISVAASQVTSGTFADARVAQSNVTQHQAALTIAETQITNGSVLARVADNENISGNWAFNGTVSGQTPTNGAHLVTKDYADALATGLDFKQSVKAATTTNITLSGSQTIDGVAISAGMRVLVKDQTDGTQNGIYVAAAGAWTRAADADNTPSNEVTSGMFCYVEEGTVNADSGWVLATNDVITLGSTNLVFTQFTGLGQITAGNGLTKSGNTINVGGTAGRIVVNVDDIDLATVTDSGTGSFKKISVDSYGRVTGTTDVVSSDITSLVDSTYVNVAGDTMTGLLTISRTGNGLVVASTDSTPANNSGIILNTTANATASSRVATIVLDANGADGAGGDYVTLNAFGSGDFTINNHSAAAITFQTNTTERMRINSSGNVLIGSTSANYNAAGRGLLELNGSTDTLIAFKKAGVSKGYLQGLSDDGFLMASVSGSAGYLAFNTNALERMRIDASGNVGVSVTPSAWRSVTKAIQVNRSALADVVSGAGTALGNNWYENASGGDAYIGNNTASLYYQTNGIHRWYSAPAGTAGATITWTPSMTLDANGNLGLGMTPSTKLDVGGSARARWFGMNTAGVPSGIGTGMAAPASDTLALYTNTAERMRIDASGNLGVGVTPNYRLSVGGAFELQQQAGTQGLVSNSSYPLIFSSEVAGNLGFNGHLVLQARGSSAASIIMATGSGPGAMAERMRIDASGNVGIGTSSPQSRLHINQGTAGDGLRFERSGYDVMDIELSDSGLRIRNETDGRTDVLIDASGNLGVGGITPASKLDVIASAADSVLSLTVTGVQRWQLRTLSANQAFSVYDQTTATERLRIDASGNVLVTGSGGLGYGTGSGGTVTQATSKSTSVTLNKPSGQITMNNAALASNAVVAFPLSCSQIAAGDVVAVSLKSGHATAGTYQVWSEASTAGAVTICVRNISGSSLSEALVLNFVVIKGATS